MIEKNIEVLRKIMYAVETGGQVYGKQRYDAFIGAGANTPNEKAITIGAGQWYAGEAKRLLQEIQRADPAQFKRLDTQSIADDLLHKNWSRYAISPTGEVDFGEGKKSIFALPDTEILIQKDKEVQMAVNTFGKGRGVYISGLPYSFENSRVLYRAVLWSASAEEELNCWYSTNYNVEVHAYVKNGKYCVVNNTYEIGRAHV